MYLEMGQLNEVCQGDLSITFTQFFSLFLTGPVEFQGDHEVDVGLWGSSEEQRTGGDFTEDFQNL